MVKVKINILALQNKKRDVLKKIKENGHDWRNESQYKQTESKS